MKDEEGGNLSWAVITFLIGAVLTIWGLLAPDTSVKKKWRKGPGTPLLWIGLPCALLGGGWTAWELAKMYRGLGPQSKSKGNRTPDDRNRRIE